MEKFKINKESIKEVLFWLIGGLLLLVATEYLLRGKLKYVKLLLLNKPGVFFVNYIVILFITCLIFIVKRKKTLYFVIAFFILALSGASKYLYIIRGVPFTCSDIYSIGDGLEIAGNYINTKMIIGVAIILLTVIAIIVALFKKEKSNKRITSLTNLVLVLILIIAFPILLKHEYYNGNMGYMRWDITASYKRNGYMYSTIESAIKYIRVKPDGYSKEAIEEIRAKVDKKVAKDTRKINKNKPNIIFIQLEAFMDPTEIKEAKFSEDPIPNFRKICEQGKLYTAKVPTTGGGTVRTEYEVMTGNDIDYLTPGEIPYNTIIKSKYYNSVATTLKSQGYTAQAIHNFQGNFYTRNNAYEKLGFDTFTSMEYMNDYQKNDRGWLKDTILTKYIKEALNNTKGQDLIYTVTVQGHSAYPTKDTEGYNYPIKVSGNLSDAEKNQLYYYVNQLKETDKFIGQIKDMVDKSKEDTLVVFYADHMPALKVFSRPNFYLDAYEAPFTFYSNFKIDNFEYSKTEAYNIGTMAMKLAGVEYGPIEKFREYMKDDPNYSKYENLIEYDMLFGENYYIKDSEKPDKNKIHMGLDKIEVTGIEDKNKYILVKGNNFTKNSYVYINNEKMDTVFVNKTTLKVTNFKNDNKKDTLVVKQLGRNDGYLSETNSISI